MDFFFSLHLFHSNPEFKLCMTLPLLAVIAQRVSEFLVLDHSTGILIGTLSMWVGTNVHKISL